MRKNKKIDANDLYIGKLIKYELYKKEEHGDIVDKWYRPVIFDPPVYIIVRDGGYGYARDIFNNTRYKIRTSGERITEGINVVLENPIIVFNDTIRYKDAEIILDKYNNTFAKKMANN